MKVYAARDKNTGKYVSDLTSHRKKFWERKNACIDAVAKYNRYSWKKYDLEVVELTCIDSNYIIDDIGYLSDWYQSSIDDTKPPVWTDEHLEELLRDFILIPRADGE